MSYLGDYADNYATLNFKFTTRTTAGVPSTLGGTPVVSVYKANGITQSTVGITLTADFDTVTGLNNVLIDLSADAFYAVADDYQVVITAGTVNSVSVVGEVVGEFSIENRFMRGTDLAALASAYTATRAGYLDNINGHTAQTGDSFARIGATGSGLTSLAQASEVTAARMSELDAATAGKMANQMDIVQTDTTTDIPALINGLDDVTAAQVLAQINAALDTVIPELLVAAPAATPTLRTGLMLLYMALRNKTVTQTSATDALEIYNDAGTLITKKLLTDDGSDLTEAQMS